MKGYQLLGVSDYFLVDNLRQFASVWGHIYLLYILKNKWFFANSDALINLHLFSKLM